MEAAAYILLALFVFGLESLFVAMANAVPHTPSAEYWVVGIVTAANMAIAVLAIRRQMRKDAVRKPTPRQKQKSRQTAMKLLEELKEGASQPRATRRGAVGKVVGLAVWAAVVAIPAGMGIFIVWGWWYRFVAHPPNRAPGLRFSCLLMLPLFIAIAGMMLYTAAALASPLWSLWRLKRRIYQSTQAINPSADSKAFAGNPEMFDRRTANQLPWGSEPDALTQPPEILESVPVEVIDLLENPRAWGCAVNRENLIKSRGYDPLWDRRGNRAGTTLGIAIIIGFPSALFLPLWLRTIQPWGPARAPALLPLAFVAAMGAPFLLMWSRSVRARNRKTWTEAEFLAALSSDPDVQELPALATRAALAALAGTRPEAIRPGETPESYQVFKLGRPLLLEFTARLCQQPGFPNDPVELATRLAPYERNGLADLAKAVAASLLRDTADGTGTS